MPPESLHIEVDVQVDGDQILGHAGDGVAEPRPFSGWLGLIGALDGLVGVAAEGGARRATLVRQLATGLEQRGGPAAAGSPRSRPDASGAGAPASALHEVTP